MANDELGTSPGARRACLKLIAGLALAAPASGCSLVGAFNAVAGRDPAGTLAAASLAYGDHPRQTLDVYRPVGAAQPRPVLLFIYGGSWSSGRRQDYAFVGSALAALGYVAVIADYRLTPDFVYPAFVDDGARALRWIGESIGPFGGDARRLAVIGHSAGAYNAAMLALDRKRLRSNGVDPALIRAFAGLSGPYDFYPWDSGVSRAAFGAWPDPRETQPVHLVRLGAPPAFLATGDADATVRPSNTRALAARLRAAGVSVDERIYPGVDHAGTVTSLSVLRRGAAPVLADLAAFLARNLGEAG